MYYFVGKQRNDHLLRDLVIRINSFRTFQNRYDLLSTGNFLF